MLPGFARSEIFRIMLFSIPRRNGGWLELIQRSASSNCVAASVFSSRYFTMIGA
jgi:hypothetical protein